MTKKIKRKIPVKTASPNETLRERWIQKRPILYFVGGFVVMMAIFYGVYTSYWFYTRVEPVILNVNAFISAKILYLLGQHVQAINGYVSSPEFSLNVKRGCDAVEPIALFISAMLSYPAPFASKAYTLLYGILIMLSLNILRIVTLFLTGVYKSSLFEFMHAEVWQVAFILVSLLLWLMWIYRQYNSQPYATEKKAY